MSQVIPLLTPFMENLVLYYFSEANFHAISKNRFIFYDLVLLLTENLLIIATVLCSTDSQDYCMHPLYPMADLKEFLDLTFVVIVMSIHV